MNIDVKIVKMNLYGKNNNKLLESKEEKMKKITLAYFYGNHEDKIGIPHNTTFPYSKKKRNEIIDKVLDNNLNVMLKHGANDVLIIWVDNGRFNQR